MPHPSYKTDLGVSEATPGPWDYVRTPYGRGALREIYSPEDGFIARITTQNTKLAHRADANARLIAAAPDLLEALRDLLAASQPQAVHQVFLGEAQDKAMAAIARAGAA